MWDSNSEIRYLVLPEQPEEGAGLSADELATWVTRDTMIGVAKVEEPKDAA